jgi:uncharacterized protein
MKKTSPFEWIAIVVTIAAFIFFLDKSVLSKEKINLRPQEPKPPFPYYQEDITFENPKAGIKLAGTLTLPARKGNFPAVVLISGSGPQNRDEEVYGHKIFLIIADYLTRNGIAVLRYDDRGTHQSQGNFTTATTEDFSTDAESAVAYLKTRKEINHGQIGLAGHSEGGLVAPMVAARSKDVAFMVLLAAPAMQLDTLLLLQQATLYRILKFPEAEIQKSQKIMAGALAIVTRSTHPATLRRELTNYIKTNPDSLSLSATRQMTMEQAQNITINMLATPWSRYILTYNPMLALEKSACPILALNGEKDYQVPPKENLAGIEAATLRGGNKNVKIVELPGLNHLFQECKTGSNDEYQRITQTFSPLALKEMSDWIIHVTR